MQPTPHSLNHSYIAVIFDLDGTLIDSLHDIADAMNRVLTANGFPTHPYDSYRTFVGKGLRNLTEMALPASVTEENIIKNVHVELLTDYKRHFAEKTALYPGIEELLDALTKNNIGLAILSNKADTITQRIAEKLLSRWPFALIIGTGDAIPRKPDPTGAYLCASALQVEPERCVYVGDSGIDMQTANRTGMLPVGVTWGFRSREELESHGASIIIEHPSELLSLWK
jgi:phosphoglycolate phosphatase